MWYIILHKNIFFIIESNPQNLSHATPLNCKLLLNSITIHNTNIYFSAIMRYHLHLFYSLHCVYQYFNIFYYIITMLCVYSYNQIVYYRILVINFLHCHFIFFVTFFLSNFETFLVLTWLLQISQYDIPEGIYISSIDFPSNLVSIPFSDKYISFLIFPFSIAVSIVLKQCDKYIQ